MKKKKRNPTDSTMRNVRAVNKRLKKLEDFWDFLSEEFFIDGKGYFRTREVMLEKKRGKK